MRMIPFFTCKKYKWQLIEKTNEVVGCNIDGELPPFETEEVS